MKQLLVVLLFLTLVNAQVSSGELGALNDLYADTEGFQWYDNSNWGTGDPCLNTWYGVMCNVTNTAVVQLILNDNDLTGTIPTTIGNLIYLNYLDLDDNIWGVLSHLLLAI
jgi:hypothetical protein